jgi:hypothetical protein
VLPRYGCSVLFAIWVTWGLGPNCSQSVHRQYWFTGMFYIRQFAAKVQPLDVALSNPAVHDMPRYRYSVSAQERHQMRHTGQ